MSKLWDVLVIGGGASGMMAAIAAAGVGKCVALLEGKEILGAKVLASGGGRCNLSNTLPAEEFMDQFGRFGRFMDPALKRMSSHNLREFFGSIGVETTVSDGLRIWPATHQSKTVQKALMNELNRLMVRVDKRCRVLEINFGGEESFKVESEKGIYWSKKIIIATGGLSYRNLGATGDGYRFAAKMGHKIVDTFPAGVPLITKESWPAACTAHTIGGARMEVGIKKHSHISNTGDLIFTRRGLSGPLALNLSGKITPLLEKFGKVPIVLNMSQGRGVEEWQKIFLSWSKNEEKSCSLESLLLSYFPRDLLAVLCQLAEVDFTMPFLSIGKRRLRTLVSILSKTPLTICDSEGYDRAFVTTGGVQLKKIDPHTLESKLVKGIYFCGEVLDLDGPCGGFNLQWAFSSGFLAGEQAALDA